MSDERAGLELPLCHKLYNPRTTGHPFTPNAIDGQVILRHCAQVYPDRLVRKAYEYDAA